MDIALTGSNLLSLMIFIGFSLPAMVIGAVVSTALGRGFLAGERWLIGLVTGYVLQAMISFIVSLAVGFTMTSQLTTLLLLLSISLAAAWRQGMVRWLPNPFRGRHKQAFKVSKVNMYAFFVFVLGALLLSVLSRRLILWRDGALATGYLDAWGDLPLHISMIMSFVSDATLHLHNTILAGHPLTYPFMADFLSAQLVKLGMPLEQAMEWPTVLFHAITLTLLYYLSYRLVRDRAAAALVPVLFILAGGLGFLWFLRDLFFSDQPIWHVLTHLPRRYTNIPEAGIFWVNPTLAHLIPQRSFLLGFPLGLSIILLWWQGFYRRRPPHALLVGLLFGLLPLIHLHTFLALLMVAAMLLLGQLVARPLRRPQLAYWLRMSVPALLVASPQLIYLLSSEVSLKAIRFHPGWMADGENLLWFWLKNLGLIIPVLAIALIAAQKMRLRRRALYFYAPFGALFLIGNLFLFSVFAYDNNKILVYWLLLSLPFASLVLVRLWRSASWWVHAVLFRTLLASLILSGGLNLLREFQNNGWVEFTAEEVQLAARLRGRSKSQAIFLAAPVHNNVLALAGRRVVLGYPGHVMSHGLPYREVEAQIRRIYTGHAQMREMLKKLHVDYIVVGPHEKSLFGEQNIETLESQFAPRFQTDHYVVYRVNGELSPGMRDNQPAN